jgi:hypothetical protein
MGQILHGSATTTEAIRRAIQNSQESLRVLAKRHGINQKTVAKWKKRTSVADLPTGPKDAKSTVLTLDEEAIIVAFRRHTLLPLDDCLYALQPTIQHLKRSSLHRCLQRHDISEEEVQKLPDWLFPYRYCRGADGRGQTISLRRYRPHLQVRLRGTAQKGRENGRCILLAQPDRSRALQAPHRADR